MKLFALVVASLAVAGFSFNASAASPVVLCTQTSGKTMGYDTFDCRLPAELEKYPMSFMGEENKVLRVGLGDLESIICTHDEICALRVSSVFAGNAPEGFYRTSFGYGLRKNEETGQTFAVDMLEDMRITPISTEPVRQVQSPSALAKTVAALEAAMAPPPAKPRIQCEHDRHLGMDTCSLQGVWDSYLTDEQLAEHLPALLTEDLDKDIFCGNGPICQHNHTREQLGRNKAFFDAGNKLSLRKSGEPVHVNVRPVDVGTLQCNLDHLTNTYTCGSRSQPTLEIAYSDLSKYLPKVMTPDEADKKDGWCAGPICYIADESVARNKDFIN